MASRLRVGFGAKPYTLYARAGKYFYEAPPAILRLTGTGGAGTLTHGTAATVSGTGFVINNNQVIHDSGQDGVGNINAGWQFVQPSACVPATYNIQNRGPNFTGGGATTITSPHARAQNFLGGCLYGSPASAYTRTMQLAINRPLPTFPWATYIKFRWRGQPEWNWATGSPPDGNIKPFVYTEGNTGPFSNGTQPFWYLSTDNGIGGVNNSTSLTYSMQTYFTYAAPPVGVAVPGPDLLISPDNNGHTRYWPGTWTNGWNAANGWVQWEFVCRYATDTTGFLRWYENGNLMMNYQQQTAYGFAGTGGTVNDCWGLTYCRMYGTPASPTPNQFWYMGDITYFHGPTTGRLMLANSPTYAGALTEPQTPVSGSSSTYNFIVNLGGITTTTGYLFYVDDAIGTAVPINGGAPYTLVG